MIPYWKLQTAHLGSLALSVPLLLAAIGILVAHFLLLRRARGQGLDVETAAMMSLVMVIAGLLGAYWFRGIYLADAVRNNWRVLLGLQTGAASFGGLAGGLLGGTAYLAARGVKRSGILRYLDALAFVFPRGWIFGRIGCSLVHDHPGRFSSSFLAVRFPLGSRFDLGLLEVVFLAAVILPLFAWWSRSKRPNGFWLGALLAIYGAFRLGLDTLHVDPPRYGPLSVDQWAFGLMCVIGLSVLVSTRTAAIQ